MSERPEGRQVARVLLDSALPQLDHLFDYAIPEELADELRVGQRVRVPFRSRDRKSFGYVIEFAEHSEFGGDLAQISEIVSPVPQLTPEVWRLARAVSDRAGGSAGDILRLAIPTRHVRVEKRHLERVRAGMADEAEADEADETAAADAAETAEGVAGAGATETADVVETVDGDAGAGTDADADADAADDAATAAASTPAWAPTAQLQQTAELLAEGARLAVAPSHGPTRLLTGEWVGGWALQLAEAALTVHALGRSVIVVLPDYRDLDQVRDALAAIGHTDTVRVDSRQSGAERYESFLRALDAEPRIVIGNRSAIYAPAHRLGAIIVWDDGDPVLAEPLTPYVHARDAALVRAEQSGSGLMFAAHSRSAEVQRLVDLGYVRPQRLPPRRTRVVHADASVVPDAMRGRVPEYAARSIRDALRSGPVLVQVATPGYAPVAVCADCGDLARCRACGGPIGFREARRGACRWCGEYATSWQCPTCDGRRLEQRGMGSGRTVEQFEQQFSGARVLLSDGDHPRERVDARPALVVATRGAEPLAAGGYRLVVLLDAPRLLGIETLRAGEDCLRWWENAAALAAPDGLCLVASGGGPVVRAFTTGRVDEWLHEELRTRHELRYPPAVRVASVSGGQTEVARALETLDGLPGVDSLGPAPVSDSAVEGSRGPGGAGLPGGRAAGDAHVVRAIVRFEYAQGAEVAKRLRGALVADAAGASARTRGKAPRRARPEALRLRFDDRGVFDS